MSTRSMLYAMERLHEVVNRGISREEYETERLFTAKDLEEAHSLGEQDGSQLGEWVKCYEEMPNEENGFLNKQVIVRARKRNQPNGKFVYDVASWNGEKWKGKCHEEKAVGWLKIDL